MSSLPSGKCVPFLKLFVPSEEFSPERLWPGMSLAQFFQAWFLPVVLVGQ